MRYILIALLFISGTASAQIGVRVGATRSQDTTYTIGPFRAQGQVRMVNYATGDSNKVLGPDANGNIVLRTKSTGGGSSTDTTSLSNRINLKVNKSNVVQNLNVPTDSTILSTAGINSELNSVYNFIDDTLRNYWDTAQIKAKLVPYTGATAAVNLGAYPLTTNKVSTDTVNAKSSMGVHIHGTGGTGIMVGAGGGGNITFDAYPSYVLGDSVLGTNSSGGVVFFNLKTKLATYLLRSDTTSLLLTQTAAATTYTPLSTFNSQAGTTYTLVAGDRGKVVSFSNGSAITVTVPSGLGATFYCTVQQMGAGQITFTGSGATLVANGGFTKSKGQYSEVSIIFTPTTNTYVLQGSME